MARKRKHESKAGQYYMAHPLDMAILRRLPKEGTQLGYHTIAATTSRLVSELNKEIPKGAPTVTSAQVQTRLRSMKVVGHVVTVPIIGGGTSRLGWQRTKSGELLYAEETGESLPDAIVPRTPNGRV
jgi:hypothetical protein